MIHAIHEAKLGPSRKGGLFKVCTGLVVSFSLLFRLRFQIKISDFRQSVVVVSIHWHRMGSTLTLDIA